MSNQFYSYLTEKITRFFNEKGLKEGEKYNLTLEDSGKVNEFYKAFKSNHEVESFNYKSYDTISINFGENNLIIAATVENITEDYLTTLRNLISEKEKNEVFKKKSILFIHNSTLDSLIGGSESLTKQGMPLSIEEIKDDIRKRSDKFSKADREIIDFAVDRVNGENHLDNSSIFEYEGILKIIEKDKIEKKDYTEFGLFSDEALESYSGKALQNRIKENNKAFKEIELIHQYGNVEDDLNDKYTEDLIEKLQSEEWREKVEFTEIVNSEDKKSKDARLTYKEANVKKTNEDLVYWEASDSDTKAGKKKRNILIFNPDKLMKINLEFKFEERVKTDYILSKPKKSSIVTQTASGKSLKVKLDLTDKESRFESIKFGNNKEKYEFKFLIVNLSEKVFESFKGKWVLKKGFIVLANIINEFYINKDNGILFEEITLSPQESKELDFNSEVGLKFKVDEVDQNVDFKIINSEEVIKFTYKPDIESIKEITGVDIWRLKNEKEDSFYLPKDGYSEDNNIVIFQDKEYYSKSQLKKYILLEQEIINLGGLYYIQGDNEYKLEAKDLDVSDELKDAYLEIVDHLKKKNTLPSFAYIGEELLGLYNNYVNVFLDEIKNLDHKDLRKKQSIMSLGTIKKTTGSKEIYLTPLHPLNIKYQLETKEYIKNERLLNNIAKTLNSSNLLPYLFYDHSTLYKVFEQSVAIEWRVYIPDSSNAYNDSKDYISKLVKGKIEEFKDHFSYLFSINKYSPMKINLVNMGTCTEVLQGIFDYIVGQLNKKIPKDQISPMEFYIYSKDNILTSFEEISFLNHMKEIISRLDLKINSKNTSPEEILEIYRNKVHFYKKGNVEVGYSHLTFYEMDRSLVEVTYENLNKLNAGLSLNGMVSTIIPQYIGNVYKSGFGLKGFKIKENSLADMSREYNTLARVSEKQDLHDDSSVIVTAISEEKIKELENIYDRSHWVTFVEPEVDINFFKEKTNDDLLIIHYSDQYTNSSNYDAITVTRKSKIYQEIIEEHLNAKLEDKNVDFDGVAKRLINYFNAINGDWLLKLSKNTSESTREKISILSAVNLSLSFLEREDIVWVPISLEELLRVSGGAGLSQKDGLFSARNLGIKGSCSDDLLFIGINKDTNDLKIYLYPIEVKIGNNSKSVGDKAINQVKKVLETLNLIFAGETFKDSYYRNFLIQVIYANIEKLKLYNIGNQENWNYLLKAEIKEKLFNDSYKFSQELDKVIGEGAVVSFKKDGHFRKVSIKEETLFFEFTEDDGYKMLNKTQEEIKKLLANELKGSDIKYKRFGNLDKKEENIDPFIEEVESSNTENISVETREVTKEIPKPSSKGMRIIFGEDDYGENLEWYPNNTNKLMHPNTGIIGTMGTGKTQFTKSLITQMYLDRKNNVGSKDLGILIFDYKGDYIKGDFVDVTNAKIIEPYHLPFNPLAIYNSPNSKPLLPLHTANTIKETIVKGFRLGQVQENILKDALMDAYTVKGIHKANRSTWDKPSPTFSDVYRLFEENEELKRDSLYAALNTIDEYELFEPDSNKTKPLYDLIDGVTVIKLSGYDQGIQNLIVAMTLDLFYSQMQIQGHSKIEGHMREITKAILVDEADNFLSQNFSSIRKILKEGREFGVGTILSTQFLNHFSTGENEYSDYIESWIVHKVAKITNKETRNIFATNSKSEEDEIISRVSDLEKHYSLVKAGNAPIKYIKDLAFWELVKKHQ